MSHLRYAGALEGHAWSRFCALVRCGAGVSDDLEVGAGGAPPASAADFEYLIGLVEHHRINNVPFLLERCALGGKDVLELGSGTGGLSVAMVEAGVASVTGVEPNRLNHEAGLWRKRAHGVGERVQLHHVPEAASLPFPEGTFDAAVCSSVLQVVPDPERRRRLLVEMHRVVKPGGLVIICATGNRLIPANTHSSRWWSNLAPGRAARLGHHYGITYWEIRRALAPLGASPLPSAGPADCSLDRWRRRVAARSDPGARLLVHRALFAGYEVLEATLCRWLGVPIEAFLPVPAIAFRKAAAPGP